MVPASVIALLWACVPDFAFLHTRAQQFIIGLCAACHQPSDLFYFWPAAHQPPDSRLARSLLLFFSVRRKGFTFTVTRF